MIRRIVLPAIIVAFASGCASRPQPDLRPTATVPQEETLAEEPIDSSGIKSLTDDQDDVE